MKTYALVGKSLSHSFSQQYFTEKFFKENITNCEYINIEIEDISNIKDIILERNISGLNITIPYKSVIIPFLDFVEENAKSIGAVNTIKVINGKLHGFNTDIIGFKNSISPMLNGRKNALILGDGGVSKSIQFVLKELNINYKIVNRNTTLDYPDLNKEIIENSDIIINTTPLGSYPNIEYCPDIPYDFLKLKHLLFDVVYNPKQSQFLTFGLENNSSIINGLEMLIIQAEESWIIWNSDRI